MPVHLVRHALGIDGADDEHGGVAGGVDGALGEREPRAVGYRHLERERRRRGADERVALIVASLVHVPDLGVRRPGLAGGIAGHRPLRLDRAGPQRDGGHVTRVGAARRNPGGPHLAPVRAHDLSLERRVPSLDARLLHALHEPQHHLVPVAPPLALIRGPGRGGNRARSALAGPGVRPRRHARLVRTTARSPCDQPGRDDDDHNRDTRRNRAHHSAPHRVAPPACRGTRYPSRCSIA